MIFKTFEINCLKKVDSLMNFASIFLLFVDLLPSFIKANFYLLYN